jgi:hypothetical protein
MICRASRWSIGSPPVSVRCFAPLWETALLIRARNSAVGRGRPVGKLAWASPSEAVQTL